MPQVTNIVDFPWEALCSLRSEWGVGKGEETVRIVGRVRGANKEETGICT